MDFSKVVEVIAATFKTDATELSALLKKEGTEDWLPEAEAKKSLGDYITDKVKTVKTEQHARGLREAWTSVERTFKAQGFTNPDGLKQAELVSAAVSFIQDTAIPTDGDAAKMSKDDLAKLTGVKELMRDAKTASEKRAAELQTALETEKTSAQKAILKSKAEAKKSALIVSLGVKMGADAAKTAAALDRLIEYGRVVEVDGKLYMGDQDGEPETDDVGKRITFEDHVKDVSSVFGFETRRTGGGANPPNGGGQGGNGGGQGSSMKFATEADFEKYMRYEPSNAKRAEAQKAWSEQSAKE